MKIFAIRTWVGGRFALAAIAGLLLAASFPKPSLSGFAWIAPGLMLAAAMGTSGGGAFRLGYVAGLARYLASLHWLLFIPFPVGAVAGWLGLSAYLALYPAGWVWLCWSLSPGPCAAPPEGPSEELLPGPALGGAEATFGAKDSRSLTHQDLELQRTLTPALSHRMGEGGRRPGEGPFMEISMGATWAARARWAILCAVIWVALEVIVGWFLTGFPWDFLGVSQYRMLPLIQIASVTGVYGVSFLVVWFSVALWCGVARWMNQPAARWVWLRELVPPVLAVCGALAFGFGRLAHNTPHRGQLKVALVQPSIPQTLIWDSNENPRRFQQIMQLSAQALATEPDLLIWPEAALPEFTEDNFQALTNLLAAHHAWMIFGADDAEPNPQPGAAETNLLFNAAFLLDPTGHLAGTYHKQRLVIFGEYIPLVRQLPFLKYLAPIGDGFTPGQAPVQFHLANPNAQLSVLICFEDTFPTLARRAVHEGTDLLLNLTNDGWFGESAAQWQHAATAVFRAVENGLPLVRCTNNGLTCWVDAHGGMHGVYFGDARGVYAAGVKLARIPLPDTRPKRVPTFYGQHGDWFGWGCVGLTVLAGAARFGRRLRPCPR